MSQISAHTDLGQRGLKGLRPALNIFTKTTSAVLISATLGACQQPIAQSAEIKTSVTSVVQPKTKAKQAASPAFISKHLKEGMAYADLRKLVIDGGWEPLVDAGCKSNVMGPDYQNLCKSDPGLSSCMICEHLPELSACSGDAYCGMHFSNGVQRLHVVTYGDYSDWNVSGDQSQMSVSGWDFSKH